MPRDVSALQILRANGEALAVATPEPWERMERETTPAWDAFSIYLHQGVTRSYQRVAAELSKSMTLIKRWAVRWDWGDRVRAWDTHLSAESRMAAVESAREEVRRMYERHGQQLQAMLQALMLPGMVVLRRMQDPTQRDQVANLNNADLSAVIRLAQQSAMAIPSLMAAERLIRGEPATIEEHRHSGEMEVEHEHNFADDIIRDPETARLATELFRRVSTRVG